MMGKFFSGQYLIWVILLLGQLHGYKSCVEKERNALLELKKYIISNTQEEWFEHVLPTWTYDTKSDCCDWEGVKCNRTSRRVTEIAFGTLYLKENSLLNLSLMHAFQDVRCLNLSINRNTNFHEEDYNQFSGMFDDVEGYKSLGRLRNLEILDLSENNFNKSIFLFLNAATSLRTLFLRSNSMDGPFPAKELSALWMLKSLDLSDNEFSSPMGLQGYKSLRRLRNLEILDLSLNSLNNSIYPFLNAATSLKSLFLRSNDLNGPFPAEELKDLTNLELLDLSSNGFNGSLSIQVLPAMRKMKALDLSSNEFSESNGLQGICEMTNMQELDLSRNNLVGPFPSCLIGLTGLQVLDLSLNKLTGKVPPALGSLGSLKYLSLLDNNFEGLFSLGSLANLSELRFFQLNSKSKSLQVESEGFWKPKFQLRVFEVPSCNLVKVPYFLLYQKDLIRINLSDNKMSGDFPHWLLENNTKLEVLLLQNNFLTSFQLQESVRNLGFLDVSDNDFSDLLPDNIGWVLPHLQYIKLADNNFQGYLPSSLGNMERIEYMDISHNSFHGTLPRSFVTGCYSMKVLTLSHNKLSGEVFPEPVNFTGIWELSMDNNLFTGKIGQGLRSLRSLLLFDISSNNLTGVIPSWIGEVSPMVLLLANNSLEGELPISLFNISYYILDLSANTLSGEIPVSWKSQGALFLQDNKLSGVIPDTLLGNVSVLDLRNNKLSGDIPELTSTQNPNTLLLRGNNLTGSVPRQLCGLENLKLLDLANNRLNGSIPSCFSNTSFVFGKSDSPNYISGISISGTRVRVSGTAFRGLSPQKDFLVENGSMYFKSLIEVEPLLMAYRSNNLIKIEFATKHRYDTYMGVNLQLFFGMDLSENELSGDIPGELGDLHELQALNLSHNKLSGLIPESLSGMKNVENLDLSFNRLQGRIPTQLTELTSLAVFNVSFNNLSGVIPQGKQFNTFEAHSFLGNPLLCGLPTNVSCVRNNFEEPDSGVEADESTVDMVSFYWSLAATYVAILIGICSSLSFDSPWSRFWFYLVDAFIHKAKNLLW